MKRKFWTIGAISFVVLLCGLWLLISGSGQELTTREISGSGQELTPREKALKTYLEVQKAIADGDFASFEKHLGPDFTAMAKSGALTPEFQRLTVRYGSSLNRFFADGGEFVTDDGEFVIDDEEGTTLGIDEAYRYSSNLVRIWPQEDLMAKVESMCAIAKAIYNEYKQSGWKTTQSIESQIGELASEYKEEIIKDWMNSGRSRSKAEADWGKIPPDRMLELISHHVQDLCALDNCPGKPKRPKYRISIDRYFGGRSVTELQIRFKLTSTKEEEEEDVGPDFTLRQFGDGTWKIVRD